MISRVLVLAAALWLAPLLPLFAAADFEYGTRPPHAVFDPNGVLPADVVSEISEPLSRIFRNEGVDVIVVILSDLEGAPPEHVAGRFASQWCDSPIHAVVLHVPGRKDSPWIVPAGKLIDSIKPGLVNQKVAEAMRNASRESKEADKVRAAATEATDMLRYWLRNAINRSEYIELERSKIRLDLETKARQKRITMLMAAASVIPVLAGVSVLYVFLRRPGQCLFPETHPPQRLGAPHAGGSHVVVELGPPPSQNP